MTTFASRAADPLVLLVAALHIAFMALEMFFWDHPVGRGIFSMTPEESAASALLASNQGLYNGLLAVGLVWALFTKKNDVLRYILTFIVVAGIFGGITVKESILLTQAFPALLALLAVWMGGSKEGDKRLS